MDINILKSKKPKILITGANGLLGQKIIKEILIEGKYEAIATGRGSCRLPTEWRGYVYEEMDITKPSEVLAIFKAYAPQYVIHAASMTDVDRCEVNRHTCFEQNVTATLNIMKGCELVKSHLIFISTDFIFDGKNGPYDELAKPNPLNYYGKTKIETEIAVQKYKHNWTIVRTNLVYGIAHDMSRSNIVLWVKKGLEQNKELSLVDDQFRTPTLAEDLAKGCLLIVEKNATGIYNISGDELLSPYDMAMLTVKFFELDPKGIKKTDSSVFSQVASRPLRTGLDISKAKNILNFKPKTFEEGIEIMAKQIKLANYKI
ncbi:SDR family oxidoreductase [Cyclobacterium marinum]|uniref:dTDP-4-dehydrorhamnose reductase n=1 Tax=Cyclobacterium marinum (strain ATCC 25205 / DSM 745 / LMG 13164 / NCIMB 1802) TaxID=880070 RepID=G0J3E1_CYCMS|nr:SDR family oxidoreductase [Cyclobacterium marinum]AEL24580.1 dTDP-4-dehydrorhamnose reductase [Cyclobacterium marinum DSM 745]MBI0399238.1 SDR family oxidoreductase [Cyclobacterium marinum]